MKTLTKNILGAFGLQGRQWLDELFKVITILAKDWSLSDLRPVENMTWHYVAKGQMNHSKPIVLKIGCDKKTIQDEYHALSHFNGYGCIKLLDFNFTYNALLLEQATPGDLLKQTDTLTFNEKITHYAKVINQLANHPLPQNHPFKSVNYWLRALDKLALPIFTPPLIAKAQELRAKLLKTQKAVYLCHGDLHLENIINQQNSWLAIDPKGIIGEIGFEAAAFDLISEEELNNKELNCTEIILERVAMLANSLNIDFNRLLSWIFIRVMLSAQWFVEDGGDPTFMLSLAKLIHSLL
ncbi:aminoglycoside phosphotransferase family protein [Legionella sp. D16C41]|uniref:aminoglycoside phosphotransferase family protein n=1 Tax=Legionella sp. D16C41 TaxID=3402688 RepID=UPI003AF9567C